MLIMLPDRLIFISKISLAIKNFLVKPGIKLKKEDQRGLTDLAGLRGRPRPAASQPHGTLTNRLYLVPQCPTSISSHRAIHTDAPVDRRCDDP